MARGWESKSVEEQQAERSHTEPAGPRLTREQAARRRELDALQLALKKVEHDLATTTHSARRDMLQCSLRDIQRKIVALS